MHAGIVQIVVKFTGSVAGQCNNQWCCEAPTVPNGVGVRPDTHPNALGKVGVTSYTYPSKNVLFMLIN